VALPRAVFFDAAGTDPEELVQMIGHVAIALALLQDREISLDEGDSDHRI
jgi:hypothetical protein